MPKGRILVADPDQEFLTKTAELLAQSGYDMIAAADGEEARSLVNSNHPDGVIASVDLPLLDGLRLASLLRTRHDTLPVYLMLPRDDPSLLEECLAAGARNVLVRPLKRTELRFAAMSLVNLRSLLRAHAGRDDDTERSVGRKPPPPGADPGTRAQFFQFEMFKRLLAVELKRAKRYGFPLAAILVAPDPAAGREDTPSVEGVDLSPITVAGRAVTQAIRDIDTPVQLAEDQFLVIMPHTDLDGAIVVAERVRRKARSLGATVSIGATSLDPGGKIGFDRFLARATRGLAEAQRSGGDRIARV